ncbi:MAG: dTMP kinase [Candidatus Heimdallarchaeota archaeon]|nr:dTMP kinase [Candidatus Heimdallarchaeota archaeon]
MKGIFVTIEGIDGSGKSTQMQLVANRLRESGYEVIITHEPTKRRIGSIIKEHYLINPNSIPEVDALLYAADRIEHYNLDVRPKLDQNYIVLTDRYVISSIVYQGAQGVEINWIKEINKMVPLPDLSIILEIPIEIAINRLDSTDKQIEKFENYSWLEKLSKIYQSIELGKIKRINGNLPINEVTTSLVDLILKEIKLINSSS